jgi:putative two-component system response regulator
MPGHGTASPTKVVIVDRDELFLHGTTKLLEGAGYECSEALDVYEARARLEGDDDIGALLCDVRLNGVARPEFLGALAADFPDVAVVVTTDVDDAASAQVAFELGAYGYLVKPFTANELLIALTGALRRRELESARERALHGLEGDATRFRTVRDVVATIEDPGSGEASGEDTIERLARAVSMQDEETDGHLERMSRYAVVLAEAVGEVDRSPEEIRLATALHDVGKIGVPGTILLKASSLSADEFAVVQRHAQAGYQLLAGSRSELVRYAASIALCHHEWWNGEGYPRGLSGEEIPVGARIAAVAEVFDALTSHRVYRAAYPVDIAVGMMTDLRGRQFEPRLIDALVDSLGAFAAIRRRFPDRELVRRTRVLVVDDQQMWVHLLVSLLNAQSGIKVVASAGSVAEAIAATQSYQPDVVLMDFQLPDGDGAQATQRIKDLLPQAKVVMLTARRDREAFLRAISAGCAGFVGKDEPMQVLVDAIRSVEAGETPLIEELPYLLLELRPTMRGLGSDLGARQREVLQLMATGVPNKAIARQLHISVNTVRNHVQSILYKLDAHSKLEAVATAVREGVISLELPAALG